MVEEEVIVEVVVEIVVTSFVQRSLPFMKLKVKQ